MNLWWTSWDAFWAMGGHAFVVWMSYGALLVAIVVESLLLVWRRRNALAAIEEERELETKN